MARAAVCRLDKKKPLDEENEKLLHLEDGSSPPKYDDVVVRKRSSCQRLRDHLPSVKEIFKLVLFSAVTVIGITFISEAFSRCVRSTESRPNSNSTHDGGIADVGMCPSSVHKTTLSMDFADPSRFNFVQLPEDLSSHLAQGPEFVRTVGSIEVRNGVQATGSDVHVDLEISGSDAGLTSSGVRVQKTDSKLVLRTAKQMSGLVAPDRAAKYPCLSISVVISISPDAKLETLGIVSDTLAVLFRPGLNYAESRVVDTKTHFESTSTYSRETVIDVGSASVTGSYPLYDLLSIHTQSGSININIEPKRASTANVKPAVLRVTSNSGSVRAICATVSVPDRDYQTSMSTSSGSVDAVILHGLRTSLRSINGRVTADLYPYGHDNSRTDIEVHGTSGSIDIRLHSSLSHPAAPLKKLYAYYKATSGSLTLFYPAQWQGNVKGTTMSGSIDFDWQGLKVIKDEKEGLVKRTIEAVRGEGEGRLVFYAASGSVKLRGESGGL